MHQQREDLDILFRKTIPEAILQNLWIDRFRKASGGINVSGTEYSKEAYTHFSWLNLPECSPDELEVRYEALRESVKGGSVFDTLYQYADQVLTDKGGVPVCRSEMCLNWNSITLRLGQDLFTTAWMAWRDVQRAVPGRNRKSFSWPAIIETDDYKLNALLKRGLAENHYHLHGSTQSFSLSWACLMNHPEIAAQFSRGMDSFGKNLNPNISWGAQDNVMSWRERLLYAAMLRALLFEKIMTGIDILPEFGRFALFPVESKVKRKTQALRFLYGEKFGQPDGGTQCLDYANCRECYQLEAQDYNRLLAGERSFLYQCFCMQFEEKLKGQEASLFYLYLVIKSNFRSELIQNNHRVGFANFASYQDRKNQIFGVYGEYWSEALRLSVCAGIRDNGLVSLEARIMPKDTVLRMREEIDGLDGLVSFAQGEGGTFRHFYVIHFAKKKFTAGEFSGKQKRRRLIPRNDSVRRDVREKAQALCQYLNKYDVETQRVWGIDACSNEIGCRPETFATEFRYLRSCTLEEPRKFWFREELKRHSNLGITYHAGEDFLDLIDGLRAVDETLCFLPLEKGDRLGHGIALGLDPGDYYACKRYNIFLTRQDLLDNLVWALRRCLDGNIEIGLNRRLWMEERALELFHAIYGSRLAGGWKPGNLLSTYYDSWQLRGDHPDLYKSGTYQEVKGALWNPYVRHMKGGGHLQRFRDNGETAELYYLYHFDPQVKTEGLRPVSLKIEPWWVEMAVRLQRLMRTEVYKRGIAVECNPTSNVLISTFKRYDRHPIITFNNYHLIRDDEPNLFVSVNTDDLGVFDTSLKNEYALLFNSIARSRHEEGNYEDDDIYAYLEYLRQNGIDMAFRTGDT